MFQFHAHKLLLVIPGSFQLPAAKQLHTGSSLFLALLLLAPLSVYSADVSRGKALHAEHCQSCHQSDIYNRPNRKVNNLDQLSQRVKQCELMNNLLWFEEDVDDVTAYLNTSFYLFNEKHDARQNYFSGLDHESAQVVHDFHHALQSGDKSTIGKLLADDVSIYEGGGVERSASEYTDHHMKADMAFLKQMQITELEHHIKVNGNTAISMLRSKMQGRYKDKDIDSESMETMVLMKLQGQWKIVHIHWSN